MGEQSRHIRSFKTSFSGNFKTQTDVKGYTSDMPFCKKCQVEYEGDLRFCPRCGSFLVKKESVTVELDHTENATEEKPKEKYICPNCKIIYEKTKSCIRCGAGVVLLSSLQPKENTVQETETKKESSQVLTIREELGSTPEHLICPACKKEHLGGKSCIRCGTELVSPDVSPKEEKTGKPRSFATKAPESKPLPISEIKSDLTEDETSDSQISKLSVQEQIKKGRLGRKIKKDYPRMVLNWSGIAVICIAIGYFIWSTYSHILVKKPASLNLPPSKETATLTATTATIPMAALPPGSSPAEAEEMKKIQNLLENIRRANLSKNINLFISCYSKDFKDREGKKKATLESWESFNFIDLTYSLENLLLSGNIARAKVEWLIHFAPKGGGQSQESRSILDVMFKKEDEDWKIGEIKPTS